MMDDGDDLFDHELIFLKKCHKAALEMGDAIRNDDNANQSQFFTALLKGASDLVQMSVVLFDEPDKLKEHMTAIMGVMTSTFDNAITNKIVQLHRNGKFDKKEDNDGYHED